MRISLPHHCILAFWLVSLALVPIGATKEEEEENEDKGAPATGGGGGMGAGGGLGTDNLQELLGGFLDGMKQAFGELQKQQQEPNAGGGGIAKEGDEKTPGTETGSGNKVADGTAASDGDDGFAGLKNLVDSIDSNQLSQFIKNIASPDNLLDWVPLKFRALVPEQWRSKIGRVLATELDKLAEVWEKLSSYKTMAKFWKAMQKKTPTLAELLSDIWADWRERWAKFEGNLGTESSEYVQNIKSTFGRWLSSEVINKFEKISPDARQNLRDSLEKAFPAVAPLMTKALENEGFRKWAEGLMANAEKVKGGWEEEAAAAEKGTAKSEKKKNATKKEAKEGKVEL